MAEEKERKDLSVVDDMLVIPVYTPDGQRDQGYYVDENNQPVPVWKYTKKGTGQTAWRKIKAPDVQEVYPPPNDLMDVILPGAMEKKALYGYVPKESGTLWGDITGNFSASLDNQINNWKNIFSNPMQAIEGFGGMVKGAFYGEALPDDSPNKQLFQAANDRTQQRIMNPIDTLRNDPVGLVGEEAAQLLAPTPAGKFLDPIGMAGVGARAVTNPAGKATRIMASSMKPKTQASLLESKTSQIERNAQNALNWSERTGKTIIPNYSSAKYVAELRAKHGEYVGQQIADLTNKYQRRDLSANEYLGELQNLVGDVAGKKPPVVPHATEKGSWSPSEQGFEILADVENALHNQYGSNITIPEAQHLKTGLYKILKNSFGVDLTSPAGFVKTANYTVASNVRKAIEERFPELANVNKSYGELADLYKAIDEQTSAFLKKNLLASGIVEGTKTSIIFGKPMIGFILSSIKEVMDSSNIKARLATALWKRRKTPQPKLQKAMLAGQEAQKAVTFTDVLDDVMGKSQEQEPPPQTPLNPNWGSEDINQGMQEHLQNLTRRR